VKLAMHGRSSFVGAGPAGKATGAVNLRTSGCLAGRGEIRRRTQSGIYDPRRRHARRTAGRRAGAEHVLRPGPA